MRRPAAIIPSLILALVHPCSSSLGSGSPAADPQTASFAVAETIVDGRNPGIRVVGLRPNEVVRIHALRSLGKWQDEGGRYRPLRQPLHAYADFAASDAGAIEVDAAMPLNGTFSRPDPLALLRTGYRFGDPALKGVRTFQREPLDAAPEDRVSLRLERGGELAAESSFRLVASAEGLTFEEASGAGWHAVYARPAAGAKLPALMTLHGSEGGGVDKARSRAAQFAARGFATLAINYFAHPWEPIKGVPTKHIEIKVEIIESARDWLRARPEVAGDRLALHGTSKGAEFALLAATRYEWISSVVAVVPSDIVWEGYSLDGGRSEVRSSWSIGGDPVPFVPLFAYDPKQEGVYRTNTERYQRSRSHHADRASAARIPIEKTKARVLLLGSDRDEVWASGEMARNLAERSSLAENAGRLEVKIYPKAGHQIAGTGTFPIRLYGEQSADAAAKDIVAEGEAAADAWQRTLRFLGR